MIRFREIARRVTPIVLYCGGTMTALSFAALLMADQPVAGVHSHDGPEPTTIAVIVVGAIGLIGNLGGFTMIKWSVEQIVERRASKTEDLFRENIRVEVDRRDAKLADLDNLYDQKVAVAFKRIDELRGELIDLRTRHDVLHGEARPHPVGRPYCRAPEQADQDPDRTGSHSR